MKFLNWKIWLGLSLIGLSCAIYLINYLIFRDANYMFRLFLAQLGFLPISVLLVTIIINQLLTQRAKRAKLAKLNMVIGAFYSEVGSSLLRVMSAWDSNLESLRAEIATINRWSGRDYAACGKRLESFVFEMTLADGLTELRDFLVQKRGFLMRLLENPNLLEHDSFSSLLLAVFHLTEELAQRRSLKRLKDPDRAHLAADVARAYVLLIVEWLAYMRHLQENYPYLFSLALRTNPFDPAASPEIN